MKIVYQRDREIVVWDKNDPQALQNRLALHAWMAACFPWTYPYSLADMNYNTDPKFQQAWCAEVVRYAQGSFTFTED